MGRVFKKKKKKFFPLLGAKIENWKKKGPGLWPPKRIFPLIFLKGIFFFKGQKKKRGKGKGGFFGIEFFKFI